MLHLWHEAKYRKEKETKMKKRLLKVTAAVCAMLLGLTACGKSNDSADKVYKIGICQIVQHDALDAATQGFKDALIKKLGEDHVKFDYQDASGDSATCATIANGFASANVDLILANATAPLQAAAAATTEIPILGTSITDYAVALELKDWSGATGINVSGTSDLAPLEEQAAMIQELFPADKFAKVGILYCTAEPNSLYQVEVVTKELEKLGYTVTPYAFTDTNDVSSVCTTAANASDVMYIPTDNTAASNTGIIDQICRPAKVPIVTGEEGICAGCGVATLSISYYELGYTTGEMAYEVLVNHADVSKMEVKYAPNTTKKYNKEICDELGIKIPDDYVAIEK